MRGAGGGVGAPTSRVAKAGFGGRANDNDVPPIAGLIENPDGSRPVAVPVPGGMSLSRRPCADLRWSRSAWCSGEICHGGKSTVGGVGGPGWSDGKLDGGDTWNPNAKARLGWDWRRARPSGDDTIATRFWT